MSKYIQPISSTWKNKHISDEKRYWNDSHSNLTEGNAGFTHLELIHGYCIKPETSEMLKKRFRAIVKVQNFSVFPAAQVTFGQC